MRFVVEGVVISGMDRRIEIEADDEREAVKQAKKLGVFAYKVSPIIEDVSDTKKAFPVEEVADSKISNQLCVTYVVIGVLTVGLFVAIPLLGLNAPHIEKLSPDLTSPSIPATPPLTRNENAVPNGWPPPTRTEIPPSQFTYSQYLEIKDGMYPDDVSILLGTFDKTESSSSGTLRVFRWSEGRKVVICMFRDDKLVSKTQLGLK